MPATWCRPVRPSLPDVTARLRSVRLRAIKLVWQPPVPTRGWRCGGDARSATGSLPRGAVLSLGVKPRQ